MLHAEFAPFRRHDEGSFVCLPHELAAQVPAQGVTKKMRSGSDVQLRRVTVGVAAHELGARLVHFDGCHHFLGPDDLAPYVGVQRYAERLAVGETNVVRQRIQNAEHVAAGHDVALECLQKALIFLQQFSCSRRPRRIVTLANGLQRALAQLLRAGATDEVK